MILQGNSIRIPLKDESVHCAISSYPYFGLRSYGLPPTVWGGDSNCSHIWESVIKHRSSGGPQVQQTKYGKETSISNAQQDTLSQFCQLCGAWLGCFGLEPTIALHVQNAVLVSREIKRVLRKDGIFYLNYGDSYSTSKNGRSAADTKAAGNDDRTFRDKPFSITELPAKNLCGIPWRVALALQDDGWILRSEIPWLKQNAMPSSVTDRPGTAHEHVFMLVKSGRYYFDNEAVRRKTGSEMSREEYNRKTGANGIRWSGESGGDADQLKVYMGVNKKDGGKSHPSGRALRTSDPFFDSLDAYIAHLQDVRDNGGLLVDSEGLPAALVVNTQSYSAAHYATFPTKLVAPLIQTMPEKVCPECGKPWQRLVEKASSYNGNRAGNEVYAGKAYGSSPQSKPRGPKSDFGKPQSVTTGWQPTCKCIQKRAPNFGMKGSELVELADEVARELAPIPAIILDPFCGSGTCGAVATELGRRFIGIDLSASYLAKNALPRSEKKTSQAAINELPLFSFSTDI